MKAELKALIIDDEAMACDMLEYLLLNHVGTIGFIKKATSTSEGLQLIHSFVPDIIFLDIQMPFMSGFELMRHIPEYSRSIIFTTAYDKYAIQAIRFSALDYLLKPVDPEELKQAVNRYMQQREEKIQIRELYNSFLENLKRKESGSFKLALPTGSGIRMVAPAEVICCTGINNYTQFFITDNTCITVSRTIKEFEELLSDHGFIRTHKSHLVNTSFIRQVKNENMLLLQNGHTIEISRRKRPYVIEALKRLRRKM